MTKVDYYWNQTFSSSKEAFEASTHLGIGAHPDDLEVMAGHGILQCRSNQNSYFYGIICTDGVGSVRPPSFADLSADQWIEKRKQEQVASAELGKYAGVDFLMQQSSDIKNGINRSFVESLKARLSDHCPSFIYTHNPFDKHLTHVAVVVHVVEALRELDVVPQKLFGCEVWRGLDWLDDTKKIALPISDPQFVAELIDCHESQIVGGKDYSGATVGRMQSNATFYDARKRDDIQHQVFAVDLKPLLLDAQLTWKEFCQDLILNFKENVESHLWK